jgi:hypothetical protein
MASPFFVDLAYGRKIVFEYGRLPIAGEDPRRSADSILGACQLGYANKQEKSR